MGIGWTNKGKYYVLGRALRGDTTFTNCFVALVTSAGSPVPDTNTLGELTEIAGGNGYTAGGTSIAFNSTDWDVWTEVDASDYSLIQLKDLAWVGSGGSIPASGSGARYAVLTGDGASVGTHAVLAYWDLTSDRSVSAGQTLTLQDCELRITET